MTKIHLADRRTRYLRQLQHIWRNITIEPLLFLYVIPCIFTGLATQNLSLEKACRVNLAYPTETCDALIRQDAGNFSREEETVQKLVAGMTNWKSLLQSGVAGFLILFWGSWSDRHGRRKPLMILPIVGELITTSLLLLCTYFDGVPMEVVGISETLFNGLFGGWFNMILGAFSYMGDITTVEDRTLRIGVLNQCIIMGSPIGMGLSGIALKHLGFYGVYSIAFFMHLTMLMYCIFFVAESTVKSPNKLADTANDAPRKSFVADFFDRTHVSDTWRVIWTNGTSERRVHIVLLLIAFMVICGPWFGEMSVFYLFTRYKFKWDEVQYSMFNMYATVLNIFGTSFTMGVFAHKMGMDDTIIGCISSMSKICSSLVYGFAQTEWHIYMAPILDSLNGTAFIVVRSIASKLVSNDELGKLNSLFGVAESILPLIYCPLYANVYAVTMSSWPGAFMLLGGAMTIPSVLIFLWMFLNPSRKPDTIDRECDANRAGGHAASPPDVA